VAAGRRGRPPHLGSEVKQKQPQDQCGSGIRAMLQQLGEYISACLQRADQCREAAAAETDDRVRGQFLALEQQWQHVAKSYEFIETLEQFLRASHTLPPEVEILPKDFPPE
jgi:hypothetical protein